MYVVVNCRVPTNFVVCIESMYKTKFPSVNVLNFVFAMTMAFYIFSFRGWMSDINDGGIHTPRVFHWDNWQLQCDVVNDWGKKSISFHHLLDIFHRLSWFTLLIPSQTRYSILFTCIIWFIYYELLFSLHSFRNLMAHLLWMRKLHFLFITRWWAWFIRLHLQTHLFYNAPQIGTQHSLFLFRVKPHRIGPLLEFNKQC